MTLKSASRGRIAICLWFDDQAEEAANFYVSIFPNARILDIARYGQAAARVAGKPEGSVLTVSFELDGLTFVALNGGPEFRFNEAVSFMVNCADQDEVDYYWDRLSEGGDENARQCGWLKDRFGVSWQVVPAALDEMLRDPDAAAVERVTRAMLGMQKLDIETLTRAYRQE